MYIADKIHGLDLPINSFIVVGSGVLDALNIRDAKDIDLIVSEDVYQKLKSEGWEDGEWVDQIILKHDIFEAGRRWQGRKIDELLQSSINIDSVPYLNLNDLKAWKREKGRPKDLEDIVLIDKYLETQS